MRFVTTLWTGGGFWKNVARYDAEHVIALESMLRRHGGHQLTVVTDGTIELPTHIDTICMPDEVASMPDYLPKLVLWSPWLHEIIGERFAAIDLDVVVLADLAPVLAGPGIRIWDEARGEPYNTSLFALDPGDGATVWNSYSPDALARARAHATRWTGDQSWVAHVLGGGLATFGESDGVIRYRGGLHMMDVPAGTRAVFFCGAMCPRTQRRADGWIRENWR